MAAALFMPWIYEIDWRIIQSIKQGQHYTSGIAEYCIHTLLKEGINYYLCACLEGGFVGRGSLRAIFGCHF